MTSFRTWNELNYLVVLYYTLEQIGDEMIWSGGGLLGISRETRLIERLLLSTAKYTKSKIDRYSIESEQMEID